VQEVSVGITFLMVPVVDLAVLRRVRLDLAVRDRLLEEGIELMGVYVFCREAYTEGRDVACRMLFDAGGVREDPATGSACACFGGYSLEHGYLGGGEIEAQIEQGHEIDRPSLLRLRAHEAGGEMKISVGGGCVAVASGRFAP
jgi:trans-2,3-dihydro-3-hydroxyanthranilate isomerase